MRESEEKEKEREEGNSENASDQENFEVNKQGASATSLSPLSSRPRALQDECGSRRRQEERRKERNKEEEERAKSTNDSKREERSGRESLEECASDHDYCRSVGAAVKVRRATTGI